MKKKYYYEEKLYKIYALYSDITNDAYVGKTISRMNKVYSHHRCLRNPYTQDMFEEELLEPEIVLLEEIIGTGSEAYRHVLAWVRCFQKSGYNLRNPDGICNQASNMLAETEAIYTEIASVPLNEYLSRQCVETNLPKKKTAAEHKKEAASGQLCLRVLESDKNAFRRYCTERNIRQADGFARLLNESEQNSFPEIRRLSALLDATEEKCAKLWEENKKLRENAKYFPSSKSEHHAREALSFAKHAVSAYIRVTYTKDAYDSLPVKTFRYDQFKRIFPQAELYQYPEDEGIYIVTLRALVWGKSRQPVQFLMCKTVDGHCLKFRFYNKKEYMGMVVRDSHYACLDSQWLFAGKRAADGAIDLMAAFPLLYPVKPDNEARKESLDEQIKNAKAREV